MHPLRKPLAKADVPLPVQESTEPHSIRFTPTQWEQIADMARRRGEEPSRLVRRLTMMALSIAQAQALAEAHGSLTGTGRL